MKRLILFAAKRAACSDNTAMAAWRRSRAASPETACNQYKCHVDSAMSNWWGWSKMLPLQLG